VRRAKAAARWVVYLLKVSGRQAGGSAVCEQGEWDEMERGRPGHYTLRAGIASEPEAEALAREQSGYVPPAPRAASSRRSTAKRSAASNPLAGREVLVVDDDDDVRRVVCLHLRRHGLTAREASGGHEAVAAYRASGGAVGVVLLDVRMPGLDGPETLARLKEVDPSVRCCFLTAGAGGHTVDALLASGARHVFHKPVADFAGLARTLHAVIRG
jgi:two-component system, OmpR family, response regulator